MIYRCMAFTCYTPFFYGGKRKMIQTSKLTGKYYNDSDCVFFRNPFQSAAYYLWGAALIDLIPSEDFKFVFVFSKSDHQRLKMKWKNNFGREASDDSK